MIVSVRRKTDGVEVTRYAAQDFTEIDGFPFADFDHIEYVEGEQEQEINPENWRIYVGAFFDRFGSEKIAILSSEDAVVQALIKDASIRQYIGLRERRDELAQMIGVLVAKGFTLDAAAILDTEPTEDERWQLSIR